jgi:hypothetical protein
MVDVEVLLAEFERRVLISPDGDDPSPIQELPESVKATQEHVREIARLKRIAADLDLMLPHVTHVITHAPYLLCAQTRSLVHHSDVRHLPLRSAWAEALQQFATNPRALCRACEFFLRWNAGDAAWTQEAAQASAPEDSAVMRCAAEYYFQGADLSWAGCSYQLAYEFLERARQRSPIPNAITYVGQTAMAAFSAGALWRALTLAKEAVESTFLSGDESPHLGHSVFGIVGLRNGDVDGALEHLAASAKGAWWTWGPSLRLARHLALAGQYGPVRDFLVAVGAWSGQRPTGVAEAWLEAFEQGRFDDLTNPGR